jgi:hypothetical protein
VTADLGGTTVKSCALVCGDRPPAGSAGISPASSSVQAVDLVVPTSAAGFFALSGGDVGGDGVGSTAKVLAATEVIGPEEFRDVARRALEARDRFLAEACAGETLDGVDPATLFLADGLLHDFRDVLFAHRLANALAEQGIRRVVWLPAPEGEGGLRGDLFFRAFRASLPAGATVEQAPGAPSTGPRLDALRRLGYPLRRLRNRVMAAVARPRRCRAVLSFSGRQWQRFGDAIADLRDRYGGDLHFWYLGRVDRELRRWAGERRLPLAELNFPTAADPDVRRFFARHHRRWQTSSRERLAAAAGCPAIAGEELGPYFDTLFGYTFPRAAQWLRRVRRALADAGPELVVGSAAFTYLNAIPLRAAGALGIPSLALSHSYVSGDHSPVPSRFFACRNRFEREGFRRAFPDDAGVLYCRNARDPLGYPVSEGVAPPADGERVVAVLTASTHFGGRAMPMLDVGRYARTLRALLLRPPGEVAGLTFRLKFHPRFDLSHLLAPEEMAGNVEIFPALGSIRELLARSWVTVLFDHFGGAAVDAVDAGAPVIFLDSAGYFYPRVEPADLTAAVRVEGVKELWALLAELAADPDRHRQLRERCRRFREERLTPADTLISDRLAEVLDR